MLSYFRAISDHKVVRSRQPIAVCPHKHGTASLARYCAAQMQRFFEYPFHVEEVSP